MAACPAPPLVPDMNPARAVVERGYFENPAGPYSRPGAIWDAMDLMPHPYQYAFSGVWVQLLGEGLNSARAMLEQNYLLTIDIPGGGPGFYIPCLLTYSANSSATFAGVTVNNPADFHCRVGVGSTIDPADKRPFESGVAQLTSGSFNSRVAEDRGYGQLGAALLVGFLVLDANSQPVFPSSRISLIPIPEPATAALLGIAFGLFAIRKVRADIATKDVQ